MAVSSTATVVSYTGNGSTTSFAVTFPFQGTGSAAELEVVQRTIATGAETTLSYTTHYTVTGGSGSTGTVVMASAPADTVQIHIRRTTTRTQTVDYTANDPFPADTHELALDRLAMGMHEIQEELDRSFKVSRTNSITTPEFVDDASTRASKLLGFSSDGNTLEATTGRVNSASATASSVSPGGSPTASVTFTASTGALAFALGIPTGATGSTGAAGADGVFSAIASQSEAETGTDNTKGMTALRVKQAVDSYGILATDIGTTVQAFDADTLKADTADELTAGFSSAAVDSGTKSSGTFTPSPDTGNFQHFTNGGAHTLGVPAKNCAMVLLMKNNSSAGTLTTSGYTKVDGDDLSTTNGDEFFLYITRYNDGSTSFSALTVKALQ